MRGGIVMQKKDIFLGKSGMQLFSSPEPKAQGELL